MEGAGAVEEHIEVERNWGLDLYVYFWLSWIPPQAQPCNIGVQARIGRHCLFWDGAFVQMEFMEQYSGYGRDGIYIFEQGLEQG
jgi:hypothetical protein